MMNWIPLNTIEQLEIIKQNSFLKPVAIFKHSTRCSISIMAKGRLDRAIQPEGIDFYYLDLLIYRPISNQVAEMFAVHHESPQLLLIKNGECAYVEAHNGIDTEDLMQHF
jgi:bacillithiol system protein YtxJ